ncbi:DNA nickase [compost metagenome]
MDPIELLMADHREVETLFDQFEAVVEASPERAMAIADQIFSALTVHAEVEEKLVYPALKDALDEPLDVLAAIEEHHVAKLLVKELKAMTLDDERFEAKLLVLEEMVRNHVEEEERELLPLAKALLPREVYTELGLQIADTQDRLRRQALNLNVSMVREYPVEQPKQV